MRHVVVVVVCSLVIPFVLGAQGTSKDAQAIERFHALQREYQAAQVSYSKAWRSAKTEDERRRAKLLKPDPAQFARRFLELARAQPESSISFDALSWVHSHEPQEPEGEQALELLADHLDDARLGTFLPHLVNSKVPAAERLLRAALEKSQDREIQAQACYTLINLLSARERRSGTSKHRTANSKEEIVALYGRLLKDFGELRPSRKSKKTYGELASAALARLKREIKMESGPFPEEVGLNVGQIAPDIQGLDTLGSPMRLADFRGKVVVLDFWGDW
jgi:hypothetical protein